MLANVYLLMFSLSLLQGKYFLKCLKKLENGGRVNKQSITGKLYLKDLCESIKEKKYGDYFTKAVKTKFNIKMSRD